MILPSGELPQSVSWPERAQWLDFQSPSYSPRSAGAMLGASRVKVLKDLDTTKAGEEDNAECY